MPRARRNTQANSCLRKEAQMDSLPLIIVIAAIVLGVILLLKLLSKPIRFALKLLINTLLGFVLLWLINFFGGEIGIELSLTLVNALVVGFLGIPGVLLLLAFRFFL
jgi:inhibitor of the pro-sigma K processing machinery